MISFGFEARIKGTYEAAGSVMDGHVHWGRPRSHGVTDGRGGVEGVGENVKTPVPPAPLYLGPRSRAGLHREGQDLLGLGVRGQGCARTGGGSQRGLDMGQPQGALEIAAVVGDGEIAAAVGQVPD